MALKNKETLLREAQRAVAARRQRAVMLAKDRQEAARRDIPGYAEAEDTIQQAGFRAAHMAAMGVSMEKVSAVLQESSTAQQRCEYLLGTQGLTGADLKPRYTCSLCSDSGVYNGRICTCVYKLMQDMRRDEINRSSALSISSFDSMRLDLYPNQFDSTLGCSIRQHMSAILQQLQEYAASFSLKSSSLLLFGSAGLGKTHAALAIAGVVLDKGYDVIYISAQELFSQLDKAHFEKNNDDSEDSMMEAVLSADLLILDDLGTEFLSPYVSSCLYTILNHRIGRKLPTIYTTNITDSHVFESRYTEKIASRLTGSCEPVIFAGSDIRQM